MDTAAPKGHAMLTDTAKRLGQIISFLKPTLEGKFVWNNSSECFKTIQKCFYINPLNPFSFWYTFIAIISSHLTAFWLELEQYELDSGKTFLLMLIQHTIGLAWWLNRSNPSSHVSKKYHRVGPWWWSSGQRPCLLLRRSKFESCKLLNLYKKAKINDKEAGVSPPLKKYHRVIVTELPDKRS